MKNILITISLMTAFFLFSCGESSSEQSSANEDGVVTSRIINGNNTYAISHYEEAGLKKPKSIQADAIDKKTGEPITPNAQEIHVGFFKSSMGPKDIELRIYANHQDALDYGVPPAEKTIDAAVQAGGAVKGAGTFAKSSYGAYVVSGNTIILCQVQIEVCDELSEGLK
jgi:ABC-type phosphate/phosphonate transport system substrate-binding protein